MPRFHPPLLTRSASLLFLPMVSLALGCETNYTSLRVRPVDTTSQLTLENVEIVVNGQTRATTDSHGIANLRNLHAGDTVLLSKPGYQTARLELKPGQYTQYSPATDKASADNFSLNNLDSIPVPLHRDGAVRRPQ